MTRLLSLCGLLGAMLWGSTVFSTEPSPSNEPFRVVSWNVENFFDVYDDPYSRDQVTKPAYVSEGRQKNVAAVLKELNADVVALQEVENRYLLQEFVDKYLPEMRYQVVLVEGNDTRGIDVALLSKIPIEEVATYQHRRFQSSAGEIMGFRRDLLRVKLGAPYNGDIYVVHLKSQFGDKVADVVREAEATEMVKIMAENGAGNPDYRAMITGDFNEVPDMPTLDIFRNSGLVDVMEGSEKYSYNKKPYLTRIDYGLMTPERQKDLGRAEILDELGDHNLRACSDHFPLLLEWE